MITATIVILSYLGSYNPVMLGVCCPKKRRSRVLVVCEAPLFDPDEVFDTLIFKPKIFGPRKGGKLPWSGFFLRTKSVLTERKEVWRHQSFCFNDDAVARETRGNLF
jgi:hypothetical protein